MLSSHIRTWKAFPSRTWVKMSSMIIKKIRRNTLFQTISLSQRFFSHCTKLGQTCYPHITFYKSFSVFGKSECIMSCSEFEETINTLHILRAVSATSSRRKMYCLGLVEHPNRKSNRQVNDRTPRRNYFSG